jgi:hypothetical protein
MINSSKPAMGNYILEWSYTKHEWKDFQHWSARRKSLLNYARFLLFPQHVEIPTVCFTKTSILINGQEKLFSGPVTELRRVEISDMRSFNIFCITYENLVKENLNEIMIPVPRGKLKEAIQLQYQLLEKTNSIG